MGKYSLFIVTFDEGEETSSTNQIATIFVGQHVQVGGTDSYTSPI